MFRLIKKILLFTTLIASVFGSSLLCAKTHIYLLAGQSNMMGKSETTAQLPAKYRDTPKNVTFFYQGRQQPLANHSYFGPEVAFAHHVSTTLPDDHHVIIKVVASGSYLSEWLPGQPLYDVLLRQFTLLPLPAGNNSLDAIIWMQGESDSRDHELALAYGEKLEAFISNLRRDLQAPNSLFVIGAISPDNPGFPAVEQVRTQQRSVHNTVTATRFVETRDLATFDNTHFNTSGLLGLGKRFAQAYEKHRISAK